MLDRLHRIAAWLLPARTLFLGVATFGFLFIVISLFMETGGEEGMFVIPSLVLFLWALSVYVFILNFAEIPGKAGPDDRLMRRAWQRGKRAWYWLVALMFLVTTAMALFISFRLISVWMRDFF